MTELCALHMLTFSCKRAREGSFIKFLACLMGKFHIQHCTRKLSVFYTLHVQRKKKPKRWIEGKIIALAI